MASEHATSSTSPHDYCYADQLACEARSRARILRSHKGAACGEVNVSAHADGFDAMAEELEGQAGTIYALRAEIKELLRPPQHVVGPHGVKVPISLLFRRGSR